MADYILTDDAKADIRHLYQYGLDTFGRAHADTYVDELFVQFEILAQFPAMGLSLDVLGHNYQRFGFGAHVIIFEPVDANIIRIEMVLNARMDYWRFL